MKAVSSRSRRTDALAAGVRPQVRIAFEGTVFTWFTILFSFAALALGENLVFLMGCVALACGQGARLLARRNVQGIRVLRSVPSRGRVGVPVTVGYEVENPRRRPAVGLEIEDRPGIGIRPVSLVLEVVGVEGSESVRRTTRIVFGRRGLRRLGSLEVRSRYPLGFFRASGRIGLDDRILVRPREGRPTSALTRWMGGTAHGQLRPSLLIRGDDAMHGVREFREGDDPRRIHWRTTARRGDLTVTEWRREQGREVVVQLGRAHGAGLETLRRFERAVSAAATIWRAANRQGLDARLDLGVVGERPLRARRHLARGLDALATVPAQGGRRPRAALRRLAEGRGSRFVVYVAAGPEPGIQARLSQAAGPGGRYLLIRADRPDVARWVKGLPS